MKFIYSISLLFSITLSNAQSPKLRITHLTGDFYIFTTHNFYKGNPVPANGMYLITTDGAVMFDTPWDTTQFQPLLDTIQARHGKKLVLCIATHSHKDKTAGLEYYRQTGAKTFTSRQTDEISKVKGEKRAEYLMEKDTVFSVGQYSFEVMYPGAGHTADNIVAWFEREKILYGGCLVKSTEATDMGNVQEAVMTEWAATIRNLQAKFKRPKYIIPGHDAWTSKQSLKHTLRLIKSHNAINTPRTTTVLKQTVADKDGNTYPVKIMSDNKLWMTANLNTNLPGSYCYENLASHCTSYGRLYTWETARKACVLLGDGWRLPTDHEWMQLSRNYGTGADTADYRKGAYAVLLTGGASGFNAVLGGGRDLTGKYARGDAHGFYWTSGEKDSSTAPYYNFAKGSAGFFRQESIEKLWALSVRCVK